MLFRSPTKLYNYIPTLSPEQAAELVARAIIKRPKSIATNVGTFAAVTYALAPKFNDFVLSVGYRLFPSSAAARGEYGEKAATPNLAQRAFARLIPGEHW